MIRNYLKLALRNLMRNKVFSFINIFGLSVGLACCILICIYIFHETGYDKHQNNKDRLFRLGTVFIDGGVEEKSTTTAAPLGRMLQSEYGEVTNSARVLQLFRDDKTLFQVDEGGGKLQSYYEKGGFLADSNIFQLLTYSFKEGNATSALAQPNSLVISESLANKLFGSKPALNTVVRVSSSTQGDTSYVVTGVFRQPASPTHLEANFFMSFRGGNMDGLANNNPGLANNNMFYTYVLLKDNQSLATLETKFPQFIQNHLSQDLQRLGKGRKYFATPISDIYLSGIGKNATSSGSKTRLFILGSIAVLTLLIACINFMNLSTANSSKRASEVGVRKVLGAERSSLLRQFLGESMLMAVLALFFALILSFALLPFFERLAGKEMIITTTQKLTMAIIFLLLALVTGLLAGSYPAFYLSSFRPIKVLKGKFKNSLAAVSLRKGLVVFQFIISIVLIAASVVIANQMSYMRKKELGFNKDQQIIVPLRTSTAKANLRQMETRLGGMTGIRSVGASMAYPGIFNPQDWLMYKQGQTMSESKRIYINLVDDGFLKTLGVQLLAGRLFSSQFPADTLTRFVVNEETVRQYGFKSPEDAVGKWLAFDWEGEQRQFNIIGVVKNFHFKDLHEQIEPFAFRLYNEANFNYMIAHASGSSLGPALNAIEKNWKESNPNEPFEYSFLDEDFQKNYETEERQAGLIRYFTLVAIIISCLGLFGLATFTAEQRTKEIGIRKVLGASAYGLVGLLSRDFLKLVIIAVLVASPLAWYFMNKWLQNFAYQTSIGWEVFALTTLIAVVIAFGTISFQAVKVALANPVKSLRTE